MIECNELTVLVSGMLPERNTSIFLLYNSSPNNINSYTYRMLLKKEYCTKNNLF